MPAVTISLEEELIERAKVHAECQRRSLSSQIAWWIIQAMDKEDKPEAASVEAAEVA